MPVQIATVRDPQSAEHLKAQAMRREGEAALRLWRAARQLDPDQATLVNHEGLALLNAGERQAAQALLLPALARWPRNIHIANLLGIALFEQGYARAALRLFEHCQRLDPGYPGLAGSLKSATAKLPTARRAPRAIREAIDAAAVAARARPRPRLSVCMIVKDEAEFIAGALASVEGLADEVILVDTGSQDDTVALARAAKARIFEFEWIGDFSAARNASLSHATGDWILVLDADERVTAASHSMIRAVMEEETTAARVVCPKIKNYTRDGRYLNDGFSGRLFPRRPDLFFSGRVHEEVGRDRPDIVTDYRLDIVLDHLGADPEVIAEKGKDERNIALLEARLAEQPDDLMTWFYLASQHWIAARIEPALEAFLRVLALFERDPGRYGLVIRHVPVPYSAVGATRGLVALSRFEEALDLAYRALARHPDHPDLCYHAAFAALGLGDHEAARALLARAEVGRLDGYDVIAMRDPSITAWRAAKVGADVDFERGAAEAAFEGYLRVYDRLDLEADQVQVAARLVELAAQLGRLEALPELTRRYLRLRPEQLEVALDVAALLAREASPRVGYALLESLSAEIEGLKDAEPFAWAAGQLAEAMGEDRVALGWYEGLAAASQDPRLWAHLSKLLLRLGDATAARAAYGVAKQALAALKGGGV